MTNFPLRLEPEFKKELQELAKKDKRSLTKFIEKILEDYVDNEKANERLNQKRINVNIDDL
ncbi:Arc-like repressor [Acinetobacter phage vB_AbaM_AB3P2]|jgi:predicted transcriptional regulator|nr:Arc-like repressor [Acinetobacter phage vB_AbaM_AB3P2]